MTFRNPIFGSTGEILVDSIRSPDYSPGAAGWSIKRDGTAEFNDATYRGQVTVGPSTAKVEIDTGTVAGSPAGVIRFPTDNADELEPAKIFYDRNPKTWWLTSSQNGTANLQPSLAFVSDPADRKINGHVGGNIAFTVKPDRITSFVTFDAINQFYGRSNITPVANTPTSLTVTGLNLPTGLTNYIGYATARSTVIGSTVQGVGVTGESATQMTIWVYRTNTTQTTVNWMIVGE